MQLMLIINVSGSTEIQRVYRAS